jgi:hypothetical protein
MRRALRRLSPQPSRRELQLVGLAILAGIALRLVYVIATKGHVLAGDEVEYNLEGRFAAAGHFLWSTTPYGVAHASTWKAPGYGAWVGLLYKLLGSHPDRVFAVQAVVLTPFTVGLTWLLGRRLFGVWAGIGAALLMAVYPNAWQFDVRLYSEAIANPLTILALLLVLGVAAVSVGRAATVGALIGALMLIRPSSLLLFAGVAVAWWAAEGWRRGTTLLAVTVGVAALVVAPWSIRNAALPGPWVPISVQSAAAYGVFNDDSAHDHALPYAWRPLNARDTDLLGPAARPRSDGALYHALNSRAKRYVSGHPAAVPKAFFWNGITRLWDLRRPSHVLNEVHFEGRTKAVTAVGLAMYWPLLVLALGGLALQWRRGRRSLVLTVAAIALAASIVYTTDAGTRYRAPFEGMIVVLACGALAPLLQRRTAPVEAAGVDEPLPVPAVA